jgi:membrane protein
MSLILEVFTLLRDSFQSWMADRAPRLAAALSFYTILSLSPTLVLVVAIAGTIVGRDSVRSEIIGQVTQVAGEEVADVIDSLIDNATQLGAGIVATVASAALIIFGASGAFTQLYDSLNAIWELEPLADRSGIATFLIKRGIAVVMAIVIGFALIGSLAVNTILAAAAEEFGGLVPAAQNFSGLVQFLVALAVATGLVALLFKFVPAGNPRWRDILPGALVTALLYIIGESVISFYLRRSGVGSVYGAAGSVVTLLLWIYYSTQILFFGAELTFVYAQRYGQGIKPAPDARHTEHPEPVDAARVPLEDDETG